MTVTDADGSSRKEIPLANVESLSLFGPVQVTTQALHVLAERGIPISFQSLAGRFIAMLDPLGSVSAEVRKAQVKRLEDAQPSLTLARSLIYAKIMNQRTLLMRNHPALPEDVPVALKTEADSALLATTADTVRGHEGRSAALYFRHFAGVFNGPHAGRFAENGRKRRPPPDPINSCLSMGYSMLTHECVAALRVAGLEPSIGAFHVSRPGRPAFALDLMEPFRPLVADSIAISAFNRNELVEGHFITTSEGCVFSDAGRKAFFDAYARRMDTEVTHPVFGYRLSYRRMIVLHARMISAWLMGELPSLAFITTR